MPAASHGRCQACCDRGAEGRSGVGQLACISCYHDDLRHGFAFGQRREVVTGGLSVHQRRRFYEGLRFATGTCGRVGILRRWGHAANAAVAVDATRPTGAIS